MNSDPKTTNFLSPLGAKFSIKKLPTVNFFVQGVAIPSIVVGEIPVAVPFSAKIQMPGDLVTFGDLVLTFRVDENMDNYLEIYNWIRSITRVDNFTEDATAWGNAGTFNMAKDENVYSDATLTVLNSAMNPNRYVDFTDCYPTSISDIPFNTTLADVDYVECTATFKFRKFDIRTTG